MSQQLSFIPHHHYKISEVSAMLEVNPSTIRHWEKVFVIDSFKPQLSKQRIYDESDVDRLRLIRKMLYDDGLTIAGAKRLLASMGNSLGKVAKKNAAAAPGGKPEDLAFVDELIRKIDDLLTIIP